MGEEGGFSPGAPGGEEEMELQQKGGPPPPGKGSYREVARSSLAGATAGLLVVDGDEQNKWATAVAAANTVVVRLTSSGRSVAGFAASAGKREKAAAVEIQAAFRGCLARRALKALKGLVKLQALVRGNIVRKRGAEMLRCMQALVRVQALARASRALQSEMSKSSRGSRTHAGPQTPEKFKQAVRSSGSKSDRSCTLKKNTSPVSCIPAMLRARYINSCYYFVKRNPSKPVSIHAVDSDRTH